MVCSDPRSFELPQWKWNCKSLKLSLPSAPSLSRIPGNFSISDLVGVNFKDEPTFCIFPGSGFEYFLKSANFHYKIFYDSNLQASYIEIQLSMDKGHSITL